MVRRHIDQMIRTRNFEARNERIETDVLVKSHTGRQSAWRGKWENAVSGKQLDNVRKETHTVSVMIQRLETDAIRDEKDNRPLLQHKRRHRLSEKNPSKSSGRRGESPSGTREKIPCRYVLRDKCTSPSCNYWPSLVSQFYKSESGCTYGEKCRFRHVEADGQPSKKSKKRGVKDHTGTF